MVLSSFDQGLFGPTGTTAGPPASENGSLTDQQDALPIVQQLVVRSDLNGNASSFAVGQPIFLQVNDTLTSLPNGPVQVKDIVEVRNAKATDVEVRSFEPGTLSTPWRPVEDGQGVHGALRTSDGQDLTWSSAGLSNGTGTTLFTVTFARAGDFSVSIASYNASTGTPVGSSAERNISVVDESGLYLFGRPSLGDWPASGMQATVNERVNFTASAATNERWRQTESWPDYYNWTVTVIDPAGLVVGGDLAQYNTGDLRVSFDALNNTSVASAWENGYNNVFYTVWDGLNGTRLNGVAAMTPTGKELTYGSGTRNAYVSGSWGPQGSGYFTFHQAGHYLLLLTLTKDGRTVSPPLVLEALVAPS